MIGRAILLVAAGASARISTRMKIVILDAYTANPGDLDWSPFEAIGQCSIHDRTPVEQTIERCGDAEIVITNKAVLKGETILALPKLRYIGVTATGYNVVDTVAAGEQGIQKEAIERAQFQLAAFLRSLGYPEVEIRAQ